MPRLSKLIEKIEDRLANKWGCWYERNKARVPLYAVLGGIGWYLYGMFLNSLKLGKESVFNTTGEVIESIWVFNPFKNLFAVFTPFGLGVSAFIALMVCLITKKGYSWFSGYKFTRDARGFDILPDGTHGTSGFATKKELAEHLELGSAALLCQMVEQGMGLSFLPEYIVRPALAAGHLARLSVPDCAVEMHRQLFYHRDKWLTPQMKAFIELVHQPAAPT